MAKSADAFRTISEVAEWLETPAHVLRFWESKFSQVKPVKRAGGRRYYRPSDMLLLGGIKKLLHHDGMTIKGVQKLLRENGIKHVAAHSQPLDDVTEAEVSDAAIEGQAETVSPPASTVVDFQRDKAKPEPAAAEDEAPSLPLEEPKPSEPAEADPEPSEAAEPEADTPDSAPEDTAEPEAPPPAEERPGEPPAPEEEPADETPVMPSFSHRPPPSDDQPEVPQEDETTEAEPVAEAPAAKPAPVDVPEDPADDIAAEPGILTQVAALRPPLSDDMADRLGDVLERLRQGGGGNGAGQGS